MKSCCSAVISAKKWEQKKTYTFLKSHYWAFYELNWVCRMECLYTYTYYVWWYCDNVRITYPYMYPHNSHMHFNLLQKPEQRIAARSIFIIHWGEIMKIRTYVLFETSCIYLLEHLLQATKENCVIHFDKIIVGKFYYCKLHS